MENKAGFLFLANGSKTSDEERNSKMPITIDSFAYASMYAADTEPMPNKSNVQILRYNSIMPIFSVTSTTFVIIV